MRRQEKAYHNTQCTSDQQRRVADAQELVAGNHGQHNAHEERCRGKGLEADDFVDVVAVAA